jgi:hypothetical protein
MSEARAARWMVPVLLIVAVLPFLPSLTFEFVLDDRWIVRGNDAIRGWRSLVSLWAMPYWATETVGEAGLYRPAFMVILSVVWNTGLRFPIFFHLMAVVAHATATYLVWRLLRRGVPSASALVGALVFAAHPIHVEAVANITNSSEVITTIWTLLLVLLVLAANDRVGAGLRVSMRTAIGAGVLAAVAMFTKESGVTAPALALLALWGWKTQPEDRADWRAAIGAFWRRWSPVVIACVVAFIIVVAARVMVLGSLVSRGGIAAEGLESLTLWQRDWAMAALGPTIVRMFLWPGVHNPMIGPRVIDGPFAAGPASALAFLAAVAVVALLAGRLATRGDRRPAVALAWMAIAFFPASNILVATGQILAERTLYLPSVGIAMLAALASALVIEWLARLPQAVLRVARIGVASTAVLLLFVSLDAATGRSQAWRNHETLFLQGIAADSGDYRAHWRLASYRLRSGNALGSLEPYTRAVELGNRNRALCQEYADALAAAGRPPAAVHAAYAARCQALP